MDGGRSCGRAGGTWCWRTLLECVSSLPSTFGRVPKPSLPNANEPPVTAKVAEGFV
jgi:hypothetical protein